LTQTQRAGTPLVVTLADGTKVCGRIQEFDRDQIVLEDSSGPIVIRKSEIRYLHEDA
jgi:sRNA-binding regulator protein Hfq